MHLRRLSKTFLRPHLVRCFVSASNCCLNDVSKLIRLFCYRVHGNIFSNFCGVWKISFKFAFYLSTSPILFWREKAPLTNCCHQSWPFNGKFFIPSAFSWMVFLKQIKPGNLIQTARVVVVRELNFTLLKRKASCSWYNVIAFFLMEKCD